MVGGECGAAELQHLAQLEDIRLQSRRSNLGCLLRLASIVKQNEHELFRLDVVSYVASSIFNIYPSSVSHTLPQSASARSTASPGFALLLPPMPSS